MVPLYKINSLLLTTSCYYTLNLLYKKKYRKERISSLFTLNLYIRTNEILVEGTPLNPLLVTETILVQLEP